MTPTILFTRKFLESTPSTPELEKRPNNPTKPIILSSPEYRGIFTLNFRNMADFKRCQSEYSDLLDRVVNFARQNANGVEPALSERSIDDISGNFSKLKNHISNSDVDFFGPHKEMIYGPGKEMFHELDDLLQNEKIPLQKRLNAIKVMAPVMGLCSGGVLTALQEAVSSLKHSTAGIKSAAYRTKVQMMESLISEHVHETHRGYQSGDEVHFVNAYFNYIAQDMGVPPRLDEFARIVERQIATSEFEMCREMVLAKLNPNVLTKAMADDYLDQVKGAQRVDVSQSIEGADLTDVVERTNSIKKATLTHEFGEVPDENYLIPVHDTYSYQFARQPTLIAKHFMGVLKEEGLVNCDDAISLTKDQANGDIKMLGDLFWRDRDGDCEEFEAKEFLATSPDDIFRALSDAGISPAEQGVILNGIARHLIDCTDAENIEVIPDAWLAKFATLFEKGATSRTQMTPVVQLAAFFGCPQALQIGIDNGADIDAKDPEGHTPLMLAAHKGLQGTIAALLAAGANPELKSPQGNTALMLCAWEGHTDAVSELLSHSKNNINAQNLDRCSALMLAALDGRDDALAVLIQAGADLDLVDTQGNSASKLAILGGHVRAARLLQIAKVPPLGYDAALLRLAHLGDADRIQRFGPLFRSGMLNPNARGPDGMTPLMMAVKQGHVQAARALLGFGADPNLQSSDGKTALILATSTGRQTETVRALLAAGADPNTCRHRSLTTTMLAAIRGDIEQLVVLIEAGADLSVKTELGNAVAIARKRRRPPTVQLLEDCARTPQRGETMLMQCVRRGRGDSVRAFAQHGQHLNAQNPRGMTATMLAAASGRLEALTPLIEANADLTLRNHQGESALMLAAKNRQAAASFVLQAALAPEAGQTPLMLCATKGDTQALRALIQHSPMTLDAQDPSGMTAVMLAAQNGHANVLKALLRAGASPSVQAHGNFTAMHIAAQKGDAEALRALVAARVNIDPGCVGRHTPLMLAAGAGHLGALTVLLDAGANLSTRNEMGLDAYGLAERNQHSAVMSALEDAFLLDEAGLYR